MARIKLKTNTAVLVCMMICIFPLTAYCFSGLEKTEKNVLYLSPFQNDLPVSHIASEAIRDEFQKIHSPAIHVFYEYMDLNHFPDTEYQKALFNLYTLKYRNNSLDLIIIGHLKTLEMWLNNMTAIFSYTPVVFYDLSTETIPVISQPVMVTGVTADVDFAESVNWYLKIRRETNEVILVYGNGKADQAYRHHSVNLKKALQGRVDVTDWSDIPMTEIKRRAALLTGKSVLVYILMFEDADGVKYRPIDAIKEISSVSSVPVLSGYDQFIGTGSIGGYMYSIEEQARAAARIGLRLMNGEDVESIPIKRNSATKFIFDHAVLKRFHIDISELPDGSVIKNRQYGIFDLYKKVIIIIISGYYFLSLIVVILFIMNRKLKKARLDLRYLNADLENQVEERTASLNRTNQKLEAEIFVRIKAEKEQVRLISELKGALGKVKQLEGILPICSSCKKIRDDKGSWSFMETYIEKHSKAEFSHGMCPDCMEKYYGNEDWFQDYKNSNYED